MNQLMLLLLTCFLSMQASLAQQHRLTGSVHDEHGHTVAFATVYIQGTNTGTAANSEGEFMLQVPAGQHTLLVRAVGYRQTAQALDMDQDRHVDVVLQAATFQLEEVVVGNAEDPAYRIIRQAIKHRRQHLEEASPYTANVYIKGVQRLLKAPSSFLGVDLDEVGREIGLDSNRTGIVYLSESESRITAHPPDNFHEEMLSSKISGNNRAFSFNRASDLQLNFYENHQTIFEGLSARPFVSPIADNALGYYQYRYMGNMEEGDMLIHKIQVIPRRKAEPVYAGDVYIVEGDWRIYGVDLLLTKESSINLLDSLSIKQDFIPISESQWQPANVHFDFVGGLFGFRVGGYFAAVFSDYTLIQPPDRSTFREVLRIEAGVNEKDSAYWNQHRALALTEEEAQDYLRKDSIRARRESKAYLDSLDRVSNRFKPSSFLLTGYQHRNRAKRTVLSFGGLVNSLLYNTVEGLALNYGLQYSKRTDTIENRSLVVAANMRYGFANRRLNGYGGIQVPIGKSTLSAYGGSQVSDLNSRGTIPVIFNTVNTLYFGRNHQKLYERHFGQVIWQYTLPANIQLTAGTYWDNRLSLPNSTGYTFFKRFRDRITSNNPFTPDVEAPIFEKHQALRFMLSLAYDFGTKYETYPNRRVYLPSKYPTLRLHYTKGIPQLLGSDVDYDMLRAELSKDNIRLGMFGNLSFMATAGTFINASKLFYPDLRHINGTMTLITDQQISSFLLLDFYTHSTGGNFAEVHAEYNMATLLTSKVPLLRRLKLQEIVGLHYLNTSESGHYGELHAGLQWANIRVMYARSFGDGTGLKGQQAIRIGLRVPFN